MVNHVVVLNLQKGWNLPNLLTHILHKVSLISLKKKIIKKTQQSQGVLNRSANKLFDFRKHGPIKKQEVE